VVLQALAFGVRATRERLTPLLRPAAALGLLVAAAAGVLAVAAGDPFLSHYHWHLPLPGGGYYHLSTTLLFDIGIYMVVVGTAVMLVSSFAEADQ
jgi:multicomponent Na+:H+ antiporter subunit B